MVIRNYLWLSLTIYGHPLFILGYTSNSYTMGCRPVRRDNPLALASGLSYVQVNNPWYNYFIPSTSVKALQITRYFMLKMVKGV